VKYRHGEDAAEAKQQLNHSIIGGREIRIVFAEENRKTPQEMRVTSHGRCDYSLMCQLFFNFVIMESVHTY
jgi:FUS-interacting serine-arginine-rich protein 1